MNIIHSISKFFKKIFWKANTGVKLPKGVNDVADIKSPCASPQSYY